MLKAGVFVCACCRLMRSTSISCQPGRNCSRRNSCKPGVRSSSPPGGAVLLWISCMKFGGSLKRILLLSSSPYLSPFLHLPPSLSCVTLSSILLLLIPRILPFFCHHSFPSYLLTFPPPFLVIISSLLFLYISSFLFPYSSPTPSFLPSFLHLSHPLIPPFPSYYLLTSLFTSFPLSLCPSFISFLNPSPHPLVLFLISWIIIIICICNFFY